MMGCMGLVKRDGRMNEGQVYAEVQHPTQFQISLGGHPVMFRPNEEAFGALSRYLDRAKLNLKDDPGPDEVLRDLEQSSG